MPLIQPASVLVSDQAGMSVGMSAATLNAPIWAQACAAHIAITPRFKIMVSTSSPRRFGDPLDRVWMRAARGQACAGRTSSSSFSTMTQSRHSPSSLP